MSMKDKQLYLTGIIDMADFIMADLRGYLVEEDRYFGIMKSYMKSIADAYSSIYGDPDIDEEYFGKILSIHKPMLKREFQRLVYNRKLSKADSCITLLHKIYEIVFDYPGYVHHKETETIKKIIDKLWENIRGRSKYTSLFKMANIIRSNIEECKISKYSSYKLDLDGKILSGLCNND